MRVDGRDTRSVRVVVDESGRRWPEVIDQTRLPHELHFVRLETAAEAAVAIRDMWVRGAPLIGATAAYGVALGMRTDPTDAGLEAALGELGDTRPTAVNLRWALQRMGRELRGVAPALREDRAFRLADDIGEEDVALNRALGEHGAALLRDLAARRSGQPVRIMTHCNAGWLATVDWGTALAPVYRTHRDGQPVYVWVSETRPRNQGASLTAWELLEEGVPHAVIADSAAGHLLRTGRVDVVITGTDRTTAAGDVCNKIGTYLKAVAARDCAVPFYAAVPGPSIDWTLGEGEADAIPIEERDGREVSEVRGWTPGGRMETVRIAPRGSPTSNFGFDVTPARLVTGLITERGVCQASRAGLEALYGPRPHGTHEPGGG